MKLIMYAVAMVLLSWSSAMADENLREVSGLTNIRMADDKLEAEGKKFQAVVIGKRIIQYVPVGEAVKSTGVITVYAGDNINAKSIKEYFIMAVNAVKNVIFGDGGGGGGGGNTCVNITLTGGGGNNSPTTVIVAAPVGNCGKS